MSLRLTRYHARAKMTPVPSPTPTEVPPAQDAASNGFLDALQPLLPDLSVGALLGFAVGVALKAIGRVVLIVVGVLFITLQVLAYFDLISIDWLRLQALTEPWLKKGGEEGGAWVQRLLTKNLPFAGAFTVGLLIGLRARL